MTCPSDRYCIGDDSLSIQEGHIHTGTVLALSVLWTIQIVLFFQCIRVLRKRDLKKLSTFTLLCLVISLCCFDTYWTVTWTLSLWPFRPSKNVFTEHGWYIASWLASGATYAIVDGLLFWRCYVVLTAAGWMNTSRITIYVIRAVLLLSFLGACAAGTVLSFESNTVITTLLIYPAISLGIQTTVTAIIVVRLWQFRRALRSMFGRSEGIHYRFISTVFLESAALQATWSLALVIVGQIVKHDIHVKPTMSSKTAWLTLASLPNIYPLFLVCSPTIQVITSYFIFYRIADGSAFSSDTLAPPSPVDTIAFANTDIGGSAA